MTVLETNPLLGSTADVAEGNGNDRRTRSSSRTIGLIALVALVGGPMMLIFTVTNQESDFTATLFSAPLLSESMNANRRLPTPTDQIQAFLHAWQEGRCDDLAALVSKKDAFEYRVTAFGGESDSEDNDDFVFSLDMFIESLCIPYQGHFEIQFEDDKQHQNLGPSFGMIRAVGSDYYVKDAVPCLAPFQASFAVSLDSHGGIQVLRELVHNVEVYNRYTQECMGRGFSLEGDENTSPKHRLLSKYQAHDTERPLLQEEMSNLDRVKEFMFLYCTGRCEEAAEYLSDSFTMRESFYNPTPVLDRDAYLDMCRTDFLTEPEMFISLAEVIDGSTVTMTGQGFQMIGNQPEGKKPCPIFATESFFMNFTADGKMNSMSVALEDTYFDDYAACQRKN